MAMNRIQFQSGLSMLEFLKGFGTEAQCEQALEVARWSDGFHCPRCNGTAYYVIRDGIRKVFQCRACRHQTSLIAYSGEVEHSFRANVNTDFSNA